MATAANPLSMVNPLAGGATTGTQVNPAMLPPTGTIPTAAPASITPQAGIPTQPALPGATAQPTTTVPVSGQPANQQQLSDIYGATGSIVGGLESQATPGTADYIGQTIINANAPNVAQGSANLNEALANSGIGPSSSVSAIENANYQSGVENSDLSELATTNLAEQNVQLGLLGDILPSAQQEQTDSSAWSIFGDVAQGVGDVAGLGTGFGTTVGGDVLSKIGV